MRALQAFEMNAELLDCLEDYARVLQLEGRVEEAVSTYTATAVAREGLALPRSSRRDAERQRDLGAARDDLGESAFERAWSIGRMRPLDDVIEHALAFAAASALTA